LAWRTLFVTISQSGASPDLITASRMAWDAGARSVGLINAAGSPLGEVVDQVLPMCAGPEVSLAATKSCLVSLAAGLMLAACWSGRDDLRAAAFALPEVLAAGPQAQARLDLGPARSIFVIGRGPGLVIAARRSSCSSWRSTWLARR